MAVTAYSMAPQKVMQKDDLMATSWAHLKEISLAKKKVRLTEIEKVQMMEILMGSNWVHVTEIWLAQLTVKQKETS